MGAWDWLKKRAGGWGAARPAVQVAAATQVPPVETPKAKRGQVVLPSFMTTSKPNPKTALPLNDPRLINTDITQLRTAGTTREQIAAFVRSSPDLSAALTAYIRTGVTGGYIGIAKNMDGTVSPDGTAALAQILTRMDTVNDYTIGYDDSPSIRALSESWAVELLTYGGMCGELVLNKALLPDKIQPVSITQIRLYPTGDGKKLRPTQKVGSDEFDLDIPTFFMVTLDQSILDAYARSPVESAMQAVLFSAEFMNDIRRIVRKAIHPRVVVTIDEEKFRKSIPDEIKYDQEKVNEYMSQVVGELETKVNSLEPEDAIVMFDTIGIEVKDHGNTNLSNEYAVVQEMADAKVAAGTKALPTVLGKSNGTSNVASAEVLMFVKYVEGSVWGKLNEMFSKMLTLAVRLMGIDAYVEFRFNAIDLRPESELESFRALRQSRLLEQLSLGMLGDEEACIQLTGHLPPKGYKPLSGTMFFQQKATPAGDGFNGASNSGSTMNQNLKSDAPSGGARGQNKKAGADVIDIGAAR